MSVNRNRALYNKATTNHEYLSMQDNFLFNDLYWEDYGSRKSGIYAWKYRMYRTWKYNRKTQWKS